MSMLVKNDIFSFLNDQAAQQMMQSDFQCVSLSGKKGRKFFFIPLRINKISMGSLNSIFHSLLEVSVNNLTHNIKKFIDFLHPSRPSAVSVIHHLIVESTQYAIISIITLRR